MIRTRRCFVKWAAAMACAAGGAALLAGCGRSPTKEIDRGLAGVVADAASRIAGKGEAVILAAPLDDVSADPTTRQKIDEIAAALKDKGFTVKPADTVPLNRMIEHTGEPVLAKDFFDAVSRNASAAVIVSLVGVPRIGPADLAKLPKARPKLLVATTYMIHYLSALPPGFVDWSIVPSSGGDEPGEPVLGGAFRVIAPPAGK